MKIQNTHECSGKAAFFKVTKQQLNKRLLIYIALFSALEQTHCTLILNE